MVRGDYERQFNSLRNKLRLSGLEDDEYKIIIYIENYILKYGRQVVNDTLTAHFEAEDDEKLDILKDILQTQKHETELFIYERFKQSLSNR